MTRKSLCHISIVALKFNIKVDNFENLSICITFRSKCFIFVNFFSHKYNKQNVKKEIKKMCKLAVFQILHFLREIENVSENIKTHDVCQNCT